MSQWRIIYIGNVCFSLGISDAATEALARKEAIDFYDIPSDQQCCVVAVKIDEAKCQGEVLACTSVDGIEGQEPLQLLASLTFGRNLNGREGLPPKCPQGQSLLPIRPRTQR
jgi:hypothetical protein